jgi:alpha-glucosidase (family GH31 glycosyl hydrolase)
MNMKFVPIVDAGISWRAGQNYSAFDQGVAQDIFLKLKSGELAGGKVWPNEAVYPDFLNPQSNEYWKQQLEGFKTLLNFDGLWQDMNEASNFCNGPCSKDEDKYYSTVANKLPYTPTGKRLDSKSVPIDAVHKDGSLELDSHSLFGAL